MLTDKLIGLFAAAPVFVAALTVYAEIEADARRSAIGVCFVLGISVLAILSFSLRASKKGIALKQPAQRLLVAFICAAVLCYGISLGLLVDVITRTGNAGSGLSMAAPTAMFIFALAGIVLLATARVIEHRGQSR
jgi:hypothetical protein